MALCFFFQAEDGIRAVAVTGVQTCALPIWPVVRIRRFVGILRGVRGSGRRVLCLLRPVALRLVLRLLGVGARAEAKCESKCACALPNGTEAPRLCWVVYHDLFSLDLDSFQSSARSPLGAI